MGWFAVSILYRCAIENSSEQEHLYEESIRVHYAENEEQASRAANSRRIANLRASSVNPPLPQRPYVLR